MSEKFTKGPWEADEWATGWTISATNSQYSVCHLDGCNNADANARLIVAAPELYEALLALTEWGCTYTSPRDSNSPHELLIAARSALAKASGKA